MREVQFREALREAMSEEMRSDEKIFMLGEEIAEYDGAYKVTAGMSQEFGQERVVDTPISELGFSGIGVGAAMNGMRPIVEFMTWNFAILAMDQILNNAAKIPYMSGGQFTIPITFRGPNAQAGQLAATHSQAFESIYSHFPGLKVVCPADPYGAKGLLKSSIRDDDPIVFLESEKMYGDKGEIPDGEYTLPIGKAEIKREGSDVTLISWGKILKEVFKTADELAKDGIHAEVIDLRTIRPMDYDTLIQSVKKTNRAVIVEESWPVASVASEIGFKLQFEGFDHLDAPVARVTQADTPFPFAHNLIAESVPNVERIMKACKDVLYLEN